MKLKHAMLATTMLALTACGGGSHRPVYSGHEESTAGVPGFDEKGKKLSPNVKLGQSYSVDGETYVPKYEPGYMEEGMASWYGPGFHGGKTANGERYDSSEMTAAHRTLPLPSMVRVTFLKTGKSAIVRVNDRGPYAHGRIIDLSKSAADAIGMTKYGTGKVRVEYLEQETRRFTTLMAGGRDPKDIDVDEEVIAFLDKQRNATSAMVADATDVMPAQPANSSVFDVVQASNVADNSPAPVASDSWVSHINPISTAHAEVPARPLTNPESVSSNDLPPAELPASGVTAVSPEVTVEPAHPAPAVEIKAAPAIKIAPAATNRASQATVIMPKNNNVRIVPKTAGENTAVVTVKPASVSIKPIAAVPITTGGSYVQLGAFASKANAESLVSKVSDVGSANISTMTLENGQSIYRVRMGPYADADNLAKALAKLQERGLDAKPIYE